MFERFTAEARQAVVDAQDAARELGHDWIGASTSCSAWPAGRGRRSPMRWRASVPAAPSSMTRSSPSWGRASTGRIRTPCASSGSTSTRVRRRAEETFGPGALERTRAGRRAFGTRIGAIPFTPRAKHALELALRASLARGEREIGGAHVLLGVLDQGENVGLTVLEHLGLSPPTVRGALLARLERDAA